ncbi:hypothetical protein FOE78_12120 [Microlunatus elymi]|uniref:LicD family protein n=1 Tax=Microlunatus elymi TaxID=2596828 RepID=A0A516PZH8_9ACTN|nr:hypothetical protein [Microlunatus elymi]QDP96552.1 hypothetical protein FOE78_12120 [Microlunatus elymi]
MTDESPLPLAEIIDEFTRVTHKFEDLDFLNAGGVLEVRAAVPAVTAVWIEVPGLTSLELASVVIEADGLEDPVAQSTLRTSKAAGPEFAEVARTKRLLDPARLAESEPELGVCTQQQQRPSLNIVFDEPVDLRKIIIRNRRDQDAERARGIQVLVRTADGWWTTLYDGIRRERELVQAVEQHFAGRLVTRRLTEAARRRFGRPKAAEPTPLLADLVRLLTAIQLREVPKLIFRELDRLSLTSEQASEFRHLVSEKIVARRQQEWNIHGIKRSFRFWSEQEKKDYLDFAIDVINCLQELNENVCLGFGSVLSVVRDHDLIPHDDDLDVIIAFEPEQATTLAEGKALIRKCLEDKGFVVTGDFTSYHWVFPANGRGQKLDAFAGIWEGDHIAWYPGKRGVLTRDMLFPVQHRPLLGRDCAIPHDPETYLERVYGPDWQTPNPHFRHTWRRKEYADLLK